MSRTFLFKSPTYIHFGAGITKILPDLCGSLKVRHLMIVTGKHVRKTAAFQELLKMLQSADLGYEIFDDILTEPTVAAVDHGTALLRSLSCDGVVAVGGGSVIDTAKAMAVLAVNPGSASDYLFGGKRVLTLPSLPLTCIPTTAGSGSEVTASTVILDENKHVKLSITHDFLFPRYALIDPEFHLSMPHSITIGTGMDAFTHAIEAFTSTTSNPLSNMYALKAISMIGSSIRTVAEKPDDIDARSSMAVASVLAAVAFVNGGLGAVHGISQSIGGITHVPHGIMNAVLLPYIMERNIDFVPEKFAQISAAMGIDISGSDTREAARKCLDAVRAVSKEIGIPSSIKEVGVTEEMFPEIIRETMNYRLLKCNPAPMTPEIISDILHRSYEG